MALPAAPAGEAECPCRNRHCLKCRVLDAVVTFKAGGHTAAVATVSRDKESLEAEVAMEQGAG